MIRWLSKNANLNIDSKLDIFAYLDGEKIDRVVIATHGFGDNAKNFSNLAFEFKIKNTLWLFAQAPKEIPMIHSGFQWFSLYDNPEKEINYSLSQLEQITFLLVHEHNIPLKKIYFMGFSQGASMALLQGLSQTEPIGGIIALSGFLTSKTLLLQKKDSLNLNCQIFLAHGNQDQVVFPALHYESLSFLKFLGFRKILTKIYPMGHNISPEEMRDVEKFVKDTDL